MRRLFKIFYGLKLRKPHEDVDPVHYLKRLAKGKKHPQDEWYFSDRDLPQYAAGDVLVMGRFSGGRAWFLCDPANYAERGIIKNGAFSPQVLELMDAEAQSGSLVLDVGANIGAYAIPLAKSRPDLIVHAFEPNPAALDRLEQNRRLNPCPNLSVFPLAVSDRDGQATFYAPGPKDLTLGTLLPGAVDGAPITVDAVTLDHHYRENPARVSVLKIDVQGYETQVLAGAGELISRCRPLILLEHEDGNFSRPAEAQEAKNSLRKTLSAHGYSVYYQTHHSPDLLLAVQWDRPLDGDLVAIPRQP